VKSEYSLDVKRLAGNNSLSGCYAISHNVREMKTSRNGNDLRRKFKVDTYVI
jgi:hypothetical protein